MLMLVIGDLMLLFPFSKLNYLNDVTTETCVCVRLPFSSPFLNQMLMLRDTLTPA